ncbi:MAG TPA: metal ABC transporter ATP-binding protein [Marinospirillum sp.]|uniref:metal ABC transporter ATP-binding protein n=1 Tax=Marinospirillum sp. TaxID=2183934 RepID=UPI002B47CD4A|nr:metal ABC transporter ATP-binding protein [Marinospirillum sp.]HKM16469.1 metal ABC transporter ATP-binding protein [Marinospirillum sp.]
MGPAIVLQHFSLAINGVDILPTINAHFNAGQLHAITGANGSGKSSLLKAILGLAPHQGRIERHWQGTDGTKGKVRPVAYVPQQSAFEPSLPITVNEFLLASLTRRPFFAWRKMTDLKKAQSLLQRVGMQDKGHLRLGELSGGERQRLLFAQALERDALLWCLDEPMTGLDLQAQALINQEIKQLREQGATLLVIHHDPHWVQQYADQVWCVDNGLFEGFSSTAKGQEP